MEKGKKLSLKRKISNQTQRGTNNFCTEKDHTSEDVIDVETITSSPDSDHECGQMRKQRKLSKCTEIENKQQEIGFLETSNPSLNKLRELIFSLAPRETDITKLSPFPPFHRQDPETCRHICAPVNINLIKERLQPLSKLQSEEELSPFPNLCKHFKNHCRETNCQNLNNIDSNEMSSVVPDKRENIQKVQLFNKASGSSLVHASSELHEPNKLRITDNKNTLTANKIQISRADDFPEDNSLIIRDRNSNLYALQSQNVQPESMNSKLRDPNSCKNITKITEQKVFGKEKRDNYVLWDGNIVGNKKIKITSLPEQKCIGKNKNCVVDSIVTETKKDFKASSLPHAETVHDQQNIPISDTMNANVTSVARDGLTLQSCPLCQLLFDSRFGQMEIDSHIAGCLSTSEDDVMW